MVFLKTCSGSASSQNASPFTRESRLDAPESESVLQRCAAAGGFFWRVILSGPRAADFPGTASDAATATALAAAPASAHERRSHKVMPDYSHLSRRKTVWELVRLCAAAAGLEFAYAAETAFVEPTLLQMHVEHRVATLTWALPPALGLALTPLLGSLSDRCRLRLGRRRPFVLALAFGVLVGLLLVPNGEAMGRWLGDQSYHSGPVEFTSNSTDTTAIPTGSAEAGAGGAGGHYWAVILIVLGTILLDFDADACQSPARAYLLDVTMPEERTWGLSILSVVTGSGSALGYLLAAIDWEATALGEVLGGQLRTVFSIVTVIFAVCVLLTVTSFREVPLEVVAKGAFAVPSYLHDADPSGVSGDAQIARRNVALPEKFIPLDDICSNVICKKAIDEEANKDVKKKKKEKDVEDEKSNPSLRQYLLSIVFMPAPLRALCATYFLSQMSELCYWLYFTDYVGQSVFEGDPTATVGSLERTRYEEGVRFACWGMASFAAASALAAIFTEQYIRRFSARGVFVGGLLTYSCGMAAMAACPHRTAVVALSWMAGITCGVIHTVPYLLVARYHEAETFAVSPKEGNNEEQPRGLGTDVAIVSSMVFLAQLLLSCGMGFIVNAAGSTTAVVASAAALAACAAISATRVNYLDL